MVESKKIRAAPIIDRRSQKASHGLTNGSVNRLQSQDRPAHDWYRFVLSFPPHLVGEYLERFGLSKDQTVLDPFCGTGTTLVEAKLKGIPSMGIEANPMAHFASKIKVAWDVSANGLSAHADKLAEIASKQLNDEGLEDVPFFHTNNTPIGKLRVLPPEKNKLLLKNSISPLPLHKTLVLLEILQQKCNHHFCDHQKLALAKALVYSISNLRFGPEVGIGKLKDDTPVIGAWLKEIR